MLERKKIVDTDYLYISARLKALEKNMIGKDKLARLAALKSSEEAVKLLAESGWGEFDPTSLSALEEQIDLRRKTAFDLIRRYAPDVQVIDVFSLRYDYHNLKALIKAQAMGEAIDGLLTAAGSIPTQRLQLMLREKSYNDMNPLMRDAVLDAIDVLARTGDPQLSDLRLDRAMAAQMLQCAQNAQSSFLLGYVRLFVDLANLRVVVRCARAGKGFDYLKRAVSPEGSISAERLYSEVTPDSVQGMFSTALLAPAAAAAAQALGQGGSLAALDMACDNALIQYVKAARYLAFGEANVIAFLAATEAELTAVRTVMSGRAAGLSEEKMIERLRVCYV